MEEHELEVKKLEDLETYDDDEEQKELVVLHVLEGGKKLVHITLPDLTEVRDLLVEDVERSVKEDKIPLLQRSLMLTRITGQFQDEEYLLAAGFEAVAKYMGFGVPE